ncbi:MAG: glycosyltransferase [Akkermansia sp.]|nr:glycosyltransferase [Akkermansia sp.]
MITVLHVSPDLRTGGTAQMAADLACALQQRGDCHNIVVSPANELVSKLRATGAEHRLCFKPNLLNMPAEVLRLRSIISATHPQIIQTYSAESTLLVTLACRKLKVEKPICIEVITAYPRRGISRFFHSGSNAFITISKHLRQILTDGILKKRRRDILMLPYGVNEKQCHPSFRLSADKSEQWRTAQPEAAGKLTLCLPAPISPLHGIEDLAPILTTLLHQGIPVHAYIAGDSRKADSIYTEQLKTKFAQAGLSEHISWMGARPDLREVMCACDIILTLTKAPATYNRPVMEALALGRPVVGYDHGVIGELLETFLPEGRIAPGDTAAVADTIAQWHTYRPSTITEIPYPYRISDTADSCMQLYATMLHKS